MLFCKNEITYTSTLEIYVFFSLENMLEYAKPGSFLRQRKSRRKWIRLQRKLYSGLPLVQPFNSDYSKEIKKKYYILEVEVRRQMDQEDVKSWKPNRGKKYAGALMDDGRGGWEDRRGELGRGKEVCLLGEEPWCMYCKTQIGETRVGKRWRWSGREGQ